MSPVQSLANLVLKLSENNIFISADGKTFLVLRLRRCQGKILILLQANKNK